MSLTRTFASILHIPRPISGAWNRAWQHKGLFFGAVFTIFFIAVALLAPYLSPYDPYAQSLVDRRIGPIWHMWAGDDARASWAHVFGTDKFGRDYLTRLLYGARISLFIGVTAAVISGIIGSTLGLLAGYFGGRVDACISFLIQFRLSIPVILIALAVVALFGSSLKIVILVIGLLVWDRFAVVVRSATMQIRSMEYISAAQAIGCSVPHILFREILPNAFPAIIVIATIEMANAILLEAALSFLGLGVPAPLPSWGLMISEAKVELFFAPWMIVIPGACLFLLVLAINLLGDGMRDFTAALRKT